MEVLQLLRGAITSGQAVELRDDNTVVIDGVAYAHPTPTAYKQSATAHFTLASLVYCYNLRSQPMASYLSTVLKRGLQIVTVAYKDHVIRYLEGRAEAEGKVDTTFRTAATSAAAAGAEEPSAGAHALDPAVALDAAMRSEVPYKTRFNILDCGNKGLKDDVFKHFLNLQQAQAAGGSGAAAASSKRPAPGGSAGEDPRKRAKQGGPAAGGAAGGTGMSAEAVLAGVRGTPIIIVPPTTSSLINMHNAEQFFSKAHFEPVDPARAGASDKPSKLTISRVNTRGHTAQFHITDNPSLLRPEDWFKVVAIVAAGPDWQFKGWKWGKKADAEDVPPVKIFDRALGFHFHYQGDAPHPNIAKWAVAPIALSRANRYADGGVANRFWTIVDNDIYSRKMFLIPKGAQQQQAAAGGAGGAAAVAAGGPA